MQPSADLAKLISDLSAYAERRPARSDIAREFIEFARRHPDCRERALRVGHFTASAFLVSADGNRTLLTHHAKLGRWLQPGGHLDGEADLAEAALREASEESGLADLVVEGGIFDLDRHWIPAREAEPGHWHYDVRFVVRATGSEVFEVSSESLALAWRSVEELTTEPVIEPSLARMAREWQLREHR
jgi:8-oxo-dGTP pyrophosphatase MutT (NUDIX family)